MVLLDGAAYDTTAALLAAGELPALEQIAADGSFRMATTVFPSTTGPAYVPFLTGAFPGSANIPGFRWFERNGCAGPTRPRQRCRSYLGAQCALINSDLLASYATLFESLPISIAINSFITRGSALRHTPSVYSYARSLLTSQWLDFDSHLRDVLLDSVHKNFTSIVCVLLAIDKFSHECGPFSEATVRAYRSCDGIIAALVNLLKRIGKHEETLLLVTSDHGHSSTDHHFDICGALADMGYRVISHPLIRPRPDADAAVMISGNAFCQIYFRTGGLWDTPVDLEDLDHVVAQLLPHPAIDIVAGRRRDGWIGVLSRRGCAAIRMRGDDIDYRILRGDPFGYPCMGASMNAQAAWQATVDTAYPDAIVQVAQLFRSARTGDLVLSAAPGYDFRRFELRGHVSSHGSLRADHMLVPLFCNRRIEADTVRSVDIHASVVRTMAGQNGHRESDGRPFAFAW
jgi:hypothetical protein